MNPANADRLSRWVTLATFGLAVAAFIVAPILALSWSATPFPGLVVEQTLVVADYSGDNWSGRLAGIGFPQRVIYLGDRAVTTPTEFVAALSTLSAGQYIRVQTTLPDGTTRTFPSVQIGRISWIDLVRLFWIPYLVGLAYLLIGVWVYRVRGHTRPARAFAHFCVWTSLSTGLMFDLFTTHAAPAIWTIAIAMGGSTLISLALLFPEEWSLIRRRAWLRLLPYGISAALAGWGLLVLNSQSDPWAYVRVWRASYSYAAIGITILLGTMLYRYRISSSALVRQQARVILLGGLIAFIPIGLWFSTSLLGIPVPFNTLLFLPFLLVFPLSLGVAILRYRLWDIDVLISRTLVYSTLTAVLLLIYFASVTLLQEIFRALVGQESDLAIVVSTIAIAALFNPLRGYIQDFIDHRFYRRKYDVAQTLAAFGASLRNQVDLTELTRRLEVVIGQTIQPAYVLTWLRAPLGFSLQLFDGAEPTNGKGDLKPVGADIPLDDPIIGYLWDAPGALELDRLDLDSPTLRRLESSGVKVILPLISQGELIGLVSLGPRLSEQGYSADDRSLLTNLAVQAAPAVRVAQLVREHQAEASERERIDQEMRVARLIQQTLLPQEVPSLPGWEMEVYWQPARAVGGDFYDFIPLPDGRLVIIVGDVADKGVPAALVMATTRATLRGAARRLLSPGEALERSNELLFPELPPGMFITCLYTVLDPVSGRLQYANAGHNLPYRRHNGTVAELRATGMPLGLMPGMSYEEHETTIQPGECLLLYSDGLVEAHSPQNEMFGFPRLQALIGSHVWGGSAMIEGLLAELAAFTGVGWEQEDDVTLLALQRSNNGGRHDAARQNLRTRDVGAKLADRQMS